MIMFIIYFILVIVLSIIGLFFRFKSHSHLAEYSKNHAIKLFWLGSHAGKKYLNEKGLRNKKKANTITIILIMITLLFF